MVEACCDAAKPLLDRLFTQDYQTWLFRVGAPFDSEQRRRYVNYSLARSARSAQIISDNMILEKVFEYDDDLRRTAGLYAVNRDKMSGAVGFLDDTPRFAASAFSTPGFPVRCKPCGDVRRR